MKVSAIAFAAESPGGPSNARTELCGSTGLGETELDEGSAGLLEVLIGVLVIFSPLESFTSSTPGSLPVLSTFANSSATLLASRSLISRTRSTAF